MKQVINGVLATRTPPTRTYNTRARACALVESARATTLTALLGRPAAVAARRTSVSFVVCCGAERIESSTRTRNVNNSLVRCAALWLHCACDVFFSSSACDSRNATKSRGDKKRAFKIAPKCSSCRDALLLVRFKPHELFLLLGQRAKLEFLS